MSRVRTGAIARLAPPVTGLALGALALGPGFLRGFLLSYDMVFVPSPPLTAAALGLAGGPPRAVPSDTVVAVISHVVPADIAQKIVLLSIFTLACSGAAALLRGFPLTARLAAGVFYSWNPYVAERLILGQWALLLGYAGLPWVLRAARAGTGGWLGKARLCLALVPAATGGFAAMSVSALVAVPAAARVPAAGKPAAPGQPHEGQDNGAAPARRFRRANAVVTVLLLLGLLSLPWLIPSLARPPHTSPSGVDAFAARADTPFGSLGSLVMLGGTWNAETVPNGYGGAVSALWLALAAVGVIGYVTRCRHDRRWPALGIAALAGLGLALIGVTAPGREMLRGLIGLWPGFAVLRDGQQFVAPLALAEATGIGSLAAWCATARQPFGINKEGSSRVSGRDPLAIVLAVAGVLVPVLLLPGLAWGAAGRLRPAQYPADWLRARAVIEAGPSSGSALVLPWAAYRRYGWNHGEAMLDPWPRLLSRTVIWNDAVQVSDLVVPAEDTGARRLAGLITSAEPLTDPLRAAGVRYVIVDAGLDGPATRGGSIRPPSALARRLAGAAVVFAGPDVVVYRLTALDPHRRCSAHNLKGRAGDCACAKDCVGPVS